MGEGYQVKETEDSPKRKPKGDPELVKFDFRTLHSQGPPLNSSLFLCSSGASCIDSAFCSG